MNIHGLCICMKHWGREPLSENSRGCATSGSDPIIFCHLLSFDLTFSSLLELIFCFSIAGFSRFVAVDPMGPLTLKRRLFISEI